MSCASVGRQRLFGVLARFRVRPESVGRCSGSRWGVVGSGVDLEVGVVHGPRRGALLEKVGAVVVVGL